MTDQNISGQAAPLAKWRRWWGIGRAVYADIDDKNMFLIAAGVAFYSILAVFPAIAAVIALWGFVADPAAVAVEVARYRALLPAEVYDLIAGQINQLTSGGASALGWASALSLAIAVWTSRAGVAAMMRGLNQIYGQPNRRGLAHYLRAVLLTLALIGVALVALACVVMVPIAMRFIPLGAQAETGVEFARWALAIIVLYAGISIVYRMGPNRREARMLWFTPGAILAVLCWTAASVGFSVYMANFSNYNEVYGSIGAVIALLMWLFLSAFLVLLGGSLNAQVERASLA